MMDRGPAFNGGNYTAQPEAGWRALSAMFDALITRTPADMDTEFPNPADMLAFQQKQADARITAKFDANDWISQTWAYDRHNVGAGPFNVDYKAALASIKAKTIVLQAGLDLLNPADEGEAASVQGHFAASSFKPADVQLMNQTIIDFLDGKAVPKS
ncbi:MAG: hypothetical protein NVSMB31_15010 [Vulcanimicrobiaceae bacterium]